MTERITRREWESLSAYLDGQQEPREKARLERMLKTRPDLRAALGELRRTRTLLRNQPTIRSPRNFTLTPEMVGVRRFQPSRSGMFQSMRLVSAFASLLLVLIVLGDVFFGRQLGKAVPLIADNQSLPELAQPVEGVTVMEAPPSEPESTESPAEIQVQKESERAILEQETPEAGMTMMVPPSFDSTTQFTYPSPEAPLPAISAEEAVTITEVAPTPTEMPAQETALGVESESLKVGGEAEPGFWTTWRILEAGLLIVGLSSGMIALYFRLTGQS